MALTDVRTPSFESFQNFLQIPRPAVTSVGCFAQDQGFFFPGGFSSLLRDDGWNSNERFHANLLSIKRRSNIFTHRIVALSRRRFAATCIDRSIRFELTNGRGQELDKRSL
jgi:hypothetical protein